VEFLANTSSARFILFESAHSISSRLTCSVIGWRILSFSMKFSRIARIASISARMPHSAAIVPASTLDPNRTSRTHSESVNPARSARDSSTRSSASWKRIWAPSCLQTWIADRVSLRTSAMRFSRPVFAFQGKMQQAAPEDGWRFSFS
jgi:hypothetical protein